MIVYLLIHTTTPEDYEMIGVYDTPGKANDAQKHHDTVCTEERNSPYDAYTTLEFVLNAVE